MSEQEIQNVRIVKAGWGTAFRIWWWFTWRSVLLMIFVVLTAIFGLEALSRVAELDEETTTLIYYGLCTLMALLIQIYLFRLLLNRKFKKYTLALIKPQEQ